MAISTPKTASKTEDLIEDTGAEVRKTTEQAAAPIREIAEKGVAQAKENYGKFKAASEEASDALEDAYATLSKGYKELGRKSVEATQANVNAHFDFLTQLISAKSPSEALELQTAYARKQFEALGAQTKELSALAQKAATESAKPLQEIATKGVKYAQAS